MLTELEEQMLKHLSQFLFLSNRQFQLLGVSKSSRVIARKTHHLSHIPSVRRPYVGVLTYPPAAKIGRIENLYYLTERGATVLKEIFPDENFDFVTSPPKFYRDYHHRWKTITAHIRIVQLLERQFPELHLEFWERYFQKQGSNRAHHGPPLHAITRVELPKDNAYIIPDVNFLICRSGERRQGLLCALEISQGFDTKRLLHQITKHCHALHSGAIAQKYRLNIGHKVLFVFTEPGLMQAVRKRLADLPNIGKYVDFFLFALFEDLLRQPESCWKKALPDQTAYSFLTGTPVPDTSSIERHV